MNTRTGALVCVTTCVLAGAAGMGLVAQPVTGGGAVSNGGTSDGGPPAPQGMQAQAALPATITISGVLRDFRAFNTPGGHADFERYSTGHRVGLVRETLDAEGKPVYAGTGKTVAQQYRDAQGRNINPALFSAALHDVQGQLTPTDAPAITTAESLAQWYRDTPGVNMSRSLPLTLTRQGETNIYVFQAQDNPATPEREGFFPADNDLFNDMNQAYGHNYFFTFELSAEFVYRRGAGQAFTFAGDDDVWVFIGGRLVIDCGGVHGPVSQTIDLDRLDWLRDGERNTLKFFFAERHTSGSNCRIETSLTLLPAPLPVTTALFD